MIVRKARDSTPAKSEILLIPCGIGFAVPTETKDRREEKDCWMILIRFREGNKNCFVFGSCFSILSYASFHVFLRMIPKYRDL